MRAKIIIACLLVGLFFLPTARAAQQTTNNNPSRDSLICVIENRAKDSLGTRGFAQWLYDEGKAQESAGNDDNAWLCYELYLTALKENIAYEFLSSSEHERTIYWTQITNNIKDVQRFTASVSSWYAPMGALAYDYELFAKSLLLNSAATISRQILNSGDSELIKSWKIVLRSRETLEMLHSQLSDMAVEIDIERLSATASDTAMMHKTELYDYAKSKFVEVEELTRQAESAIISESSLRRGLIPVDFHIDWRDVQRSLREDEAVVEYFSWSDSAAGVRYGAIVIVPKAKHPVVVPLTTEEYIRLCLNDKVDYQELYHILWQPLKKHLRWVKEIFIIPSGILHTVPFGGLSGLDGEYLLDKYTIHHILSGKDVIAYRKKEQRFSKKNILLIGGADYDVQPDVEPAKTIAGVLPESDVLHDALRTARGQGFRYLPGSLAEVNAISTTLSNNGWGVRALVDTDATKMNLISTLADSIPEALHISTHGFWIPDRVSHEDSNRNLFRVSENPLMRSGLLFSGANMHWNGKYDPEVIDNGVLTALEIANMDLSGVKLVVLSACETGRGGIDGSEGVYGLQRAFRIAGADAMIVSLWSISDTHISELMTLLYRNIAAGLPLKTAFDFSIKTIRLRYPSKPSLWAGIVLIE